MESRREKYERCLNKLEKYLESAKDVSKYSADQFDV
jgi:hypothetical protein